MKKTIILLFISCSAYSQNFYPPSICGDEDNRVPSFDPKVARSRGKHAPCTVTMIGRSCAISAGHCRGTFGIAEFDVEGAEDGSYQDSKPEKTFSIDQESLLTVNEGRGQDYAVIRLLPNSTTGKYAGDDRGYYRISSELPRAGERVSITGYGIDRENLKKFAIQQIDDGEILEVIKGEAYLSYNVDTMSGNSGSAILNDKNEIIGIHNNGGCQSKGESNNGTLIYNHHKLKLAIRSCLDWERQNL
jgi:V8-like Glu-specific endopeptidase